MLKVCQLQNRLTKVQYKALNNQSGLDNQSYSCVFNPGSGVATSGVVPSVIQYSRAGDVVGWGFDPVVAGAVVITGLKLCLPHEDDRRVDPKMYPVIGQSIQRRHDIGKTVVMVLTDFMTRLWQLCKPQIIGNEPDVSWRLIITHPVGWNIDKLKRAIDAAIVAPDEGNSTYTVCFLAEAEAALIAVLDAQGIQLGDDDNAPCGQETQFYDGETVVVVDFGGLTVVSVPSKRHLISYRFL